MNEEQQQYHYMYVLVCADETLYTGYTTDVEQRVAKHNAGKGAKYTACRGPVRLLASARFATKHEAMSAEYQFKRLSRAEKLALVERAGEEHPFAEILAERFSLGEGQRVRHAEELEEETVATNDILIIVDVQNDFTTGALGNPDAAAKVAAIAARARGFEGTVILTQDTHEADYLETVEGRNLPVEHCVKGTEGWELSDELQELAAEQGWKVYEKPTFGSIALAQDLVAMDAADPIDSIELVGFCTDICVVSNALLIKAYLPEVEVRIDADLCAGTTPEAHEAALVTMRSCHIVC